MSLKRKTRELVERREQVLQGGGEKAVKKQLALGKMTARERIIAILDENSFHEYDLFARHEWIRKSFPVMASSLELGKSMGLPSVFSLRISL